MQSSVQISWTRACLRSLRAFSNFSNRSSTLRWSAFKRAMASCFGWVGMVGSLAIEEERSARCQPNDSSDRELHRLLVARTGRKNGAAPQTGLLDWPDDQDPA